MFPPNPFLPTVRVHVWEKPFWTAGILDRMSVLPSSVMTVRPMLASPPLAVRLLPLSLATAANAVTHEPVALATRGFFAVGSTDRLDYDNHV